MEFGDGSVLKTSSFLKPVGFEERKRLWVGKGLSLFRMSEKGVIDGEQLALLQYLECSDPLDNIDKKLGRVCLIWSADDRWITRGEKRGWGGNEGFLQWENGLEWRC